MRRYKLRLTLAFACFLIYLILPSLYTLKGNETLKNEKKGMDIFVIKPTSIIFASSSKPSNTNRKSTRKNIRNGITVDSTLKLPMAMTMYETQPTNTRSRVTFAARPKRSMEEIYGEGCKKHRGKKIFRTLFKSWKRVASRRNITHYFICFGSLLGSWLHGYAVPYDHDIDVCIFRKDLPKLYPEEAQRPINLGDRKPHLLIQRSAPHPASNTPRQDCQGRVVTSHTDKCALLNPHARILLGKRSFLDVFVLADNGPSLYDEYKVKTYPRDVILPFMPCTFLGKATQCPNKIPEYLAIHYGQNFVKPKKVCQNGEWINNVE